MQYISCEKRDRLNYGLLLYGFNLYFAVDYYLKCFFKPCQGWFAMSFGDAAWTIYSEQWFSARLRGS